MVELKHRGLSMQSLKHLIDCVSQALAEDVGTGDISAQLIPADQQLRAMIISRESAILCGMPYAQAAFYAIDPRISQEWHFNDGDRLPANQPICFLTGPARGILTAERTALNFLQTLSATASYTRHCVDLIAHTPCLLLDTRKTLPGLREAQKYAVRIGGGHNHRMGLYDAYLIKENHIAALGSVTHAIRAARAAHPEKFLAIEVENITQYQEAINEKPDRIMLDNFSEEDLHNALKLPHNGISLEVSGNIDEKELDKLANLGVDCVSMGKLTKSVEAIDLSLRYI